MRQASGKIHTCTCLAGRDASLGAGIIVGQGRRTGLVSLAWGIACGIMVPQPQADPIAAFVVLLGRVT